jgi:regulatory protein
MDLFEKYYTVAVLSLSRRPRSEKELRETLTKKKAPEEIIQRVLETLREQKFVNDEDFARWWVEQRTRFRPKSDRVIKYELRQKGITDDIVEQVFSHRETDDLDSKKAKELIDRRLPRVASMSKEEQYQKLAGFLARRGFDWDTIKKTLNEALKIR